MTYKNSFKLLFSNFSLVGKVLCFLLINLIIIFGLSYVLVLPVAELLSQNNWFENARNYYVNFLGNLNLPLAVENLGVLLTDFINIISANFSQIYLNIILILFTIFVFGAFLNGLYSMVITNSLYYFMSNNVKFGFLSGFISTLRKNLKYNLLSLVTKLPFNLLIYVIIFYMFNLFSINAVFAFLAPFLIVLAYILLIATKNTIFSSWTPAIVVFDKGILHDVDKAVKITGRRIIKVFTNSIYMTLTIFVINVFAALVTFGVSLLITVPVSIVLVACLNMVLFYSNYGMRYYVDEFNVFVPKKLETTETLNNIKYLI